MKRIIVIVISFLLLSNFVYASDSERNIVLEANQVKIQVNGIVCSFCSFGVEKNLSKLDFLNASKLKHGVLVDVENQRITLAIKKGKKIDLMEVYDSIKKGGYEPVTFYLRVAGDIEMENVLRDQANQVLYNLKSGELPKTGSVEVDLHFNANIIPSLSTEKSIEASLDRVIE